MEAKFERINLVFQKIPLPVMASWQSLVLRDHFKNDTRRGHKPDSLVCYLVGHLMKTFYATPNSFLNTLILSWTVSGST